MQKFKLITAQKIKAAMKDLWNNDDFSAEEIEEILEYPPDSSMGDIAFPCFKLSKSLRNSPVKIAEQLMGAISGEEFSSVTSTGGYLNFKASNTFLLGTLKDILDAKDKYGASDEGHGKVVVLDYSSPNISKPFHIGHLGTTVIGHSLKLLHQFAGYKCIGINYLGDWGTQNGKQIVAFKRWGDRERLKKRV